jgi:hypothetical protein
MWGEKIAQIESQPSFLVIYYIVTYLYDLSKYYIPWVIVFHECYHVTIPDVMTQWP